MIGNFRFSGQRPEQSHETNIGIFRSEQVSLTFISFFISQRSEQGRQTNKVDTSSRVQGDCCIYQVMMALKEGFYLMKM